MHIRPRYSIHVSQRFRGSNALDGGGSTPSRERTRMTVGATIAQRACRCTARFFRIHATYWRRLGLHLILALLSSEVHPSEHATSRSRRGVLAFSSDRGGWTVGTGRCSVRCSGLGRPTTRFATSKRHRYLAPNGPRHSRGSVVWTTRHSRDLCCCIRRQSYIQ